MGDLTTFDERVRSLRINSDAIQQIEFPGECSDVIPNEPGKQKSLQIYAAIITNDGYIGVDEAKKGLAVFGEELRDAARKEPGKHPNIDRLEAIVANDQRIRVDILRKPSAKTVPHHVAQVIPMIAATFGTPFHIIDERAEINHAVFVNETFEDVGFEGRFKEYFALKACPTPRIVRPFIDEGCGLDCSSLAELILATEFLHVRGEDIFFNSNNTRPGEFKKAKEVGAIITLDDITMIPFLEREAGIPETICFRYNPGVLRRGNSIIGKPEESKYGLRRDQIFEALKIMKRKGVKRFGLHTMIASNELDEQYHIDTGAMMMELRRDAERETGVKAGFLDLGGGYGTAYKPEQIPPSIPLIAKGIKEAEDRIIGDESLKIFMENGRMMVGPFSYLVTKVIHPNMEKHRLFAGVDASMADLMRPGMYGAYHHITVLGKENAPHDTCYNVVGSLCENNDQFARNRRLPRLEEGDFIIVHNSDGHGRAMGFNYNGKTRCGEVVYTTDDRCEVARRHETITDQFATLRDIRQIQ